MVLVFNNQMAQSAQMVHHQLLLSLPSLVCVMLSCTEITQQPTSFPACSAASPSNWSSFRCHSSPWCIKRSSWCWSCSSHWCCSRCRSTEAWCRCWSWCWWCWCCSRCSGSGTCCCSRCSTSSTWSSSARTMWVLLVQVPVGLLEKWIS